MLTFDTLDLKTAFPRLKAPELRISELYAYACVIVERIDGELWRKCDEYVDLNETFLWVPDYCEEVLATYFQQQPVLFA